MDRERDGGCSAQDRPDMGWMYPIPTFGGPAHVTTGRLEFLSGIDCIIGGLPLRSSIRLSAAQGIPRCILVNGLVGCKSEKHTTGRKSIGYLYTMHSRSKFSIQDYIVTPAENGEKNNHGSGRCYQLLGPRLRESKR